MVDFKAVGLSYDDRFGDLFTIRFVPSIVFVLDVQVEAAFAAVGFRALGVGALKLVLNFIRTPSVMFFASRKVPLSCRACQVLLIIVVLLDLKYFSQQ